MHYQTLQLIIFFFVFLIHNNCTLEFTIQLGLIEINSAFKNETIFCGFIKDLSAEEEHEKEHQLKEWAELNQEKRRIAIALHEEREKAEKEKVGIRN